MKQNLNIALIRGSYTNSFELQSYTPLKQMKNVQKVTVFSSFFPLDANIELPLVCCPSPHDLGTVPFTTRVIKLVANRTLGDSQLLWGIESKLANYHILHTADPHYYYSFQCARLKQNFPHKLLISTSWETIPFNNETTAPKKNIKKLVQKHTDLFICHTQKARTALLCENINPKKIKVIRLGIDTKRFAPSNKKNNTILFVGRFCYEKNPLALLNAFVSIASRYPKHTLVFSGHGPLEHEIKKTAIRLGLEKRTVITSSSYLQIHKLYQQADIFILPSVSTPTWEEQYGMVLLEALSCGVPIIATKSGAIPEIVGSAGFLVSKKSPYQLAQTLNTLLSRPELMKKHATLSRERAVKLFDRSTFAYSVLKLYEQYLGNHTGAKRRR